MLYDLARALLFQLDPERAHDLVLQGLWTTNRCGLARLVARRGHGTPRELFGLTFPNALGLAAGLDKNGDAIDALGALGFGHVELGTVTPRPQPGNPKPRLFRIPEAGAVVNRMGFNNAGVDHLVARLRESRFGGIKGVNIGKNATTPIERAHEDYLACYEKVVPHADYVVVNVSSPNTTNLRELQRGEALRSVFEPMLAARPEVERRAGKRVPILVKIAPDLDDDGLGAIATAVRELGIDGIVATNTTVARDGLPEVPAREEPGGLSGLPLRGRSRAVVQRLRELVGPELPILGVGGIASAEDARAMIHAGADLVQIYTGFVYRGPELVGEIVDALG